LTSSLSEVRTLRKLTRLLMDRQAALPGSEEAWEEHLAQNPDDRPLAEQIERMWDDIGRVPAPNCGCKGRSRRTTAAPATARAAGKQRGAAGPAPPLGGAAGHCGQPWRGAAGAPDAVAAGRQGRPLPRKNSPPGRKPASCIWPMGPA
jgi:ferric-dicitrate binding protein FerR (iron transport regulator)